MEESASIWQQALQWFLLIGGGMALVGVIAHEKRHPADRHQLTDTLAGRSWEPRQVFILLATLVMLYLAAGFTGQFFQGERRQMLPYVQLLVTLIIYAVLMLEAGIISRIRGGSWTQNLGVDASSFRKIRLVPLIYLATIPLIIVASKLYQLLLTFILRNEPEVQEVVEIVSRDMSLLKMLYIGMAVFAAPVYEELLYRGVFLPYMVKRSNLAVGTVLGSVLFAVMHNNAASLISLLLLSAVLSLAYWRTGSLWVSIGVHMLFNAVTIIALNI
ncbi:CPBP family intramembrane glutamic endopeptidase [Pontiella agarivorans]|uniref:CPBP family intramembrane metalloprotease n=1 Tax=Pontiella agarivorans TaxID=3038953 RepID=A0ABU5MZZ1_9BACT|nr:CPBP family intramembrane glutamic endopeptidase [Pontiella agarivorans]MDZ8119747.1 CPBP family intramembrane metalloprotease [Pontiella agarivorans]